MLSNNVNYKKNSNIVEIRILETTLLREKNHEPKI